MQQSNDRIVVAEASRVCALPGLASMAWVPREGRQGLARLALVLFTVAVIPTAAADSVREDLVRPSYYTGTTQYFGESVDLNHDRMIVGAPRTLTTGDVYIFNRNGHGDWLEEARLLPPSDAPNVKRFGKSVALIDGYAFVGADGSFEVPASGFSLRSSTRLGAVFVYRDNGHGQWRYDSRFLSSSTAPENYGFSIDAERDGASYRLAVGAPLRKDAALQRITGAAYVYTPLAFQSPLGGGGFSSHVIHPFTPPLTSNLSDPEADSMQFGHDVDIHGDRLLVGAPGWYDQNGRPSQKGRAYLYEKSVIALRPGWVERQQLQLMGSSRKHKYGHSVALQADRAVVGNPCADSRGCGEAHVFELLPDGATFYHAAELESLVASVVHFGSSVATNGIRILVGAAHGKASLFKRVAADTWNPLEDWYESTGSIWESGPSSLAINDLFAAVGRKYDEINPRGGVNVDTGRAEVRRLEEGLLLPEFPPVCRDLLTCRLGTLNP